MTAVEPRRRLPAAERRQQLLAAARQAFAEGEVGGTTIESIARVAGVTPAVIYQHFAGKEELYSAANRPITLDFVRKIHDNLDRYVRIQLSLAEENRQRAHQEHIKLINLCEAADRAKALKLLSGHINGVRDDLINHLKRHPPE